MATMATAVNVELEDIAQQEVPDQIMATATTANGTNEIVGHSLPPVDGGKAAWRLLCAAFVFEALLWGFPLSFGVFQNYYSRQHEFQDSPYISVIGTVASGMSYMAAPIMIAVIKRFKRYRRLMIYVGWPICLLALVAGSFATTLGGLVVTQGVMYGLGFMIFYYPILDMLSEYWHARKGMMAGIMCSASGVSGAVFPFAIEASLSKYGYPTTLRAIAVGLFVITGPLIPLLKGRLPESESSVLAKTDWSFLRRSKFWVYSVSNLMMGFGYFFPFLYIPSYATVNGISSTKGALLLALMSVSQVFGQQTFGHLSDGKVPLNLLAGISALVAGVMVYTGWGLAHTFPVLAVFAILYGFFASGYTALWLRMGTSVSSEPSAAFAAYGLLNVGKGIGNVLAGPISGALLAKTVDLDGYGCARYGPPVLFSGTCLALSAVIIPLFHLRS